MRSNFTRACNVRTRRTILMAFLIVAAAREAAADPGDIYHVKSASTLKTEKGSELKLPPGYFLDEKTWQERDSELKAAQEARTRLAAENDSLRKSADDIPWKTVGCAFLFGAFVGFLGYEMK